jgi:hypothetical protein
MNVPARTIPPGRGRTTTTTDDDTNDDSQRGWWDSVGPRTQSILSTATNIHDHPTHRDEPQCGGVFVDPQVMCVCVCVRAVLGRSLARSLLRRPSVRSSAAGLPTYLPTYLPAWLLDCFLRATNRGMVKDR